MRPLPGGVIVESLLPPFVAAFIAALLPARIRPRRGAGQGATQALALAGGFLAGYLSIRGLPVLPPQAAVDKLPFLLLFGFALALPGGRALQVLACGVFAGAAVVWLLLPRLGQTDPGLALAAVATWLAGSAGLVLVTGTRQPSWHVPAGLGMAALALGTVALFSRSVLAAELALALTAALFAVALACALTCVPPASAWIGATAGPVLLGLGSGQALFGQAPALALALAWCPLLAAPLSLLLARCANLREDRAFALLLLAPAVAAGVIARARGVVPGSY